MSEQQPEITQEQVRQALSKVQDPARRLSLIELNMVDNVAACDGNVKVDLVLASTADPNRDEILKNAKEAIQALPGAKQVTVGLSLKTPPATAPFTKPANRPTAPVPSQQLLPNVKNIIAISSGKGGVGKTSVSVNMACALAQLGYQVGLIDADIYGPNVPIMMGLRGKVTFEQSAEEKPLPPEKHGVKVVSIGFFVQEEQPIIWRGPMLDTAIRQFLKDFEWGDLDFLLVDLPPGTGDAQLTIMQAAQLSGAIIVTTPQEVALHDSRKGLAMFINQKIPVLGIVENMSYFVGDDGKRYEIFGHGGGRAAAEKLELPFLGEVPIIIEQREKADQGQPVVVYDSEGSQAQVFRQIAENMVCNLEVVNQQARVSAPVS